MRKEVLKDDGFTLIEVVIYIVMVGVFMAAIGLPLINSIRESDAPDIATVAYFLATEKLEELSAATTGSITDETPPTAVSGYGDYTREVIVTDVNCDDLSTPEPGSGCRDVTVTVYHAKVPNGVAAEMLRTSY